MTGAEILFQEANWKIPKLVKGDLIRFNYWNSDMTEWYGVRGTVVKVRYLSAKPLTHKARDITRGNIHYTVYTKWGFRSFYNQRMCNVEKILKK